MSTALKLLGIAGSLRKGSYNRGALRTAQELAPESLSIETFDLQGIPPFNGDQESPPPERVVQLKAAVRAADAILFATPEFNYSIPGVLKNAIDVGSRPYGKSAWGRKPCAVVSVSPGAIGGFGANHHLRQSLVFLGMPTMQQPEAYIGGVNKLLGEDGKVAKPETKQFLGEFMQAFAAWVERNSGQ